MKKLLIAVMCAGVSLSALAAPSVKDAQNINRYCGTYGAATMAVYNLKESGFAAEYVKKSLIADGNGKELTNVLTDYAYTFRSGLPPEYVRKEAKRFCIESVSGAQANKKAIDTHGVYNL